MFLNGIPNQLQNAEMLIGIADTLLHLPETFPAAYLKVYNPIITQCLRLSGALQHFDLAKMLECPAPQLDKARLSESLVGMAFLPLRSTSRIFSLRCRTCRVSSMPVFLQSATLTQIIGWVHSESHQKGPLERTAGLPIVLGFPESDNKLLTCRSMCRPQPWWPSWLAARIGVPSALQPNM